MARKRKGRNPQKNAKKAKVNNSKTVQPDNQNSNDDQAVNDVSGLSRGNEASVAASSVTGSSSADSSATSSSVTSSSVTGSSATSSLVTGTSVTGSSVTLLGADELDGSTDQSVQHHPAVTTDRNASSAASGWGRGALVEGTRSGKMPRPWFKKWGWWFLPLSLFGGAVGAWWGIRHIEGQVQAVAPEILQAAGIDTSGLTFNADYRNIAVAGELPQGVTVERVERLLEESTGAANEDIRYATVTARVAPAPEPEPKPESTPVVVEPTGEISIAAFSDGQSIRLTGNVPNQQHADKLLASAALAVGEGNVIDELSVLGLAPSALEPELQIDRLAQVLPQLGSGIRTAELALGDETFSGSIDALDAGTKTQLDPIVATASGSTVTVTAPEPQPAPVNEPQQLDVFANYQGQQIILYGQVIHEAQSQTLYKAAAEAVGENNVVSTLKVLRPDNVPAASDAQVISMADTLRQYGGLRSAESRLYASELYLRGVATNSAAKQSVDQSLQSALNEGLSVDSQVSLIGIEGELNQLQDEFDFLAGEIRENVVFATNSDVLDSRATVVLDKVAAAIERFERARVVISGHTDSVGPADGNQILSARRASAVLVYLADRGVNVERMRAIGLGESQPIGDNNTETGRQQNRRVEFTAVERF